MRGGGEGDNTSLPFQPDGFCDLIRYFGSRQNTAVTGVLRPAKVLFDHLYIWQNSPLAEGIEIKTAIRMTATKITGSNLPK